MSKRIRKRKQSKALRIASSISKKHPYGISPRTGKPYKSARSFSAALRRAEKRK